MLDSNIVDCGLLIQRFCEKFHFPDKELILTRKCCIAAIAVKVGD